MSFLYIICLFLVNLMGIGNGARILGIFYWPSYSHKIVFQPIYRELSKRGHEVLVITPDPLNDSSLTNLTEIDASLLYKHNPALINSLLSCSNYRQMFHNGMRFVNIFTEEMLKIEEFQKIYQNAEMENFDLVLVEAFTSLVPAFGHLFNAPSIGIYSLEATIDTYSLLGGIVHPAIYGGTLLDFEYPVPILQKFENIYNFLWTKFYMKYVNIPAVDNQAREYFGKDFPPIAEIEDKISMLFVTKNLLMSSVRPMPPNIIQLDFIQVQEPKPLPRDLEDILNNSTRGAIYFSLGSNTKSASVTLSKRNAIIKAFSEIPYTVLWKWESDEVPGVSNNVITRKWFSQQDVLAHPKIKLFITQGGLQSSEEAIARSIPLVGIPMIGDQQDNINKLVNLGVAVELPLKDLTADSLKEAIMEVAENRKYSEKMKEIHRIAFDQPMAGLERAVWWSEYVIRNKGAPALKSTLAQVSLYEYLMLDVIAVLLVGLILLSLVLKKLASIIFRTMHRLHKKKKGD